MRGRNARAMARGISGFFASVLMNKLLGNGEKATAVPWTRFARPLGRKTRLASVEPTQAGKTSTRRGWGTHFCDWAGKVDGGRNSRARVELLRADRICGGASGIVLRAILVPRRRFLMGAPGFVGNGNKIAAPRISRSGDLLFQAFLVCRGYLMYWVSVLKVPVW